VLLDDVFDKDVQQARAREAVVFVVKRIFCVYCGGGGMGFLVAFVFAVGCGVSD